MPGQCKIMLNRLMRTSRAWRGSCCAVSDDLNDYINRRRTGDVVGRAVMTF